MRYSEQHTKSVAPSSNDGRSLATSKLWQLGELQGQLNQWPKRVLSIRGICRGVVDVTVNVHADGGTAAASPAETEDDTRVVGENKANALQKPRLSELHEG